MSDLYHKKKRIESAGERGGVVTTAEPWGFEEKVTLIGFIVVRRGKNQAEAAGMNCSIEGNTMVHRTRKREGKQKKSLGEEGDHSNRLPNPGGSLLQTSLRGGHYQGNRRKAQLQVLN